MFSFVGTFEVCFLFGKFEGTKGKSDIKEKLYKKKKQIHGLSIYINSFHMFSKKKIKKHI